MERKAFLKVAASSLIVAATLAGCSSAGMKTQASGEAVSDRQASSQADKAEMAIHDHKAEAAIAAAEAAVSMENDNPGYRTLLGRAYLMAGRFASAQTAFEDAMTLGGRDPRTIVSLALVKVAQGQPAGARDLLVAHMDVLPAADYGLAMAMAGDPNEAVRVLSQAIHDPSAGVKERQNLAYSYALAGRWKDAQLMASQDMGPKEAAQRVMGWAALAQPGAESERVIAMVGVKPVGNDAGLPSALALNAAPKQAEELAMTTPQVEPALEPVQEEAVAFDAAPAAVPAAAPMPVRVLHAPIIPMREAAVEPSIPARRAEKAAFRQPVSTGRGPVAPEQGSKWVVQLGAYDSMAVAKEKWGIMSRRNATLGAFPSITSEISLNGQAYYRLAVAGFSSREGAMDLCRSLKAKGNRCFVRLGGVEAEPSKWVMTNRAPMKVASR